MEIWDHASLSESELQKDRVREGGERETRQRKEANVKGRDINSRLFKMCVKFIPWVLIR